jgi:hypothetical protein
MKRVLKFAIIFGFVFLNKSELFAQTESVKLNQVELMKQFIGTWKGELGNGMEIISHNKEFASGLLCTSDILKDGKIVESIVQLFGYDEKVDKFIIAELKESKPTIEICSAWFSTPTKGEIIITNPQNALFSFTFEFLSESRILQRAIQNGKIVNEIFLNKESND